MPKWTTVGLVAAAMHLAIPGAVAFAADGVALYCGEGGYCYQTGATLDAFAAAGATPVEEIDSLASLSDYRVLVVMSPRDGLSPASIDALTSFAADPERWLVLVGDRPEGGFEDANLAINEVLDALGLSEDITLDALSNVGDIACAAPADELVPGHPLLDGVTHIDTNRSSRIEVGSGDTLVIDGGNVVLAAAGNVLLSSDSNILSEGCGYEADGNLRLFSNLFTVAPPVPATGGSTGGDDGTGDETGQSGDGAATSGSATGDGGADDTAGNADADATEGLVTTATDTDGATPAEDGDDGGCGCTSAPASGPGALALGLLCLGVGRRRRGPGGR